MVDNEVMMMAIFSRSLLLIAGGLVLSNACGQISYESQRQAMIKVLATIPGCPNKTVSRPLANVRWLCSDRFRATSLCRMSKNATRMKIGHCR